jgi:exodeoxyribonuclease-3
MRIVSWNVNGIRSCWDNGLSDLLSQHAPDLITFQEVKSQQSALPEYIAFPEGYTAIWHCGGRPGYSGVGAYVKIDSQQPVWHVKGIGIPEIDAEGRVLTLEFEQFFLVTAYFPNAGAGGRRIRFKQEFCSKLQQFCERLLARGKGVVLTGDFNIAPTALDLYSPDTVRGEPGTLPAENAWMKQFLEAGWVDVFRRDHPGEEGHYTWWSFFDDDRQHNRGWRIDHVVASQGIAPRVQAHLLPGVGGSDHCPVVAEID